MARFASYFEVLLHPEHLPTLQLTRLLDRAGADPRLQPAERLALSMYLRTCLRGPYAPPETTPREEVD